MGNPEELYPEVVVYRNALKNTDDFLDSILDFSSYIEPWSDWYTFGRQTVIRGYNPYSGELFPNEQQWEQSRDTNDNPVSVAVANAFYYSTQDYVFRHNIRMQNWSHGVPTINTHRSHESDGRLAMQYHTDFIMSQSEWSGFKHWITCNIYINDNYEGGGLSFKVFKNETEYDKFSYSPSAGDALVFPSHHPYYHGVKKTLFGEKFFIRTFWGYEYEGSAEWNKNKELLGETWIKVEKERANRENQSSMWMQGYLEED